MRNVLVIFEETHGATGPSPADYGVPHGAWRAGQFESFRWAADGKARYNALEAPTGSGKSAIAKALGARTADDKEKPKVDILTKSKSLQQGYRIGYNAFVMMGMDNHRCVHSRALGTNHTAGNCYFPDKMSKCPEADHCLYLIAKDIAAEAPFVTTNYAYWLHAHMFKMAERRWLVCDEGHNLSDIVLDHAGITINRDTRLRYHLPAFPRIMHSRISAFNKTPPEDVAKDWLGLAAHNLRDEIKRKTDKNEREKSSEKAKKIRQMDLFCRRLERITAYLGNDAEWFIRAGPAAVDGPDNTKVPGLVVRPLTARYHFPSLFNTAGRILIMSATIGDPTVFAKELGIDPARYATRSIESQWPVERRPIYDLGAPRMGRNSSEAARNKQARLVAEAIKACPPHWTGLLHVTSWRQAHDVAKRLTRFGIGHRLFMPPRAGTDKQIAAWEQHRDRNPGALMLTPSAYEGFDGRKEQINGMLKIPFPYYGDPFEVARRKFDPAFALQRTAWRFDQTSGRTRRGREQDYDLGDERRGLVFVADGYWTNIRDYMSASTRESITAWA